MRRTALVIAITVTVAAVVWFATTGSSSPASSEPATEQETATDAASVKEVEQEVRFGVPVGWPHDEAGARAAAVSAVSLTGEIATAGFVTRADMIGVLASVRYAPTLTRSTATQLTELQGDLGAAGVTPGQVVFRELALTATVDRYDPDRAVVRVWSVVVAGATGRSASPRQLWRTVTVELVWETADWRIDNWSSTPGPTPALATGAPVASLAEIAAVTGWPTVGGG